MLSTLDQNDSLSSCQIRDLLDQIEISVQLAKIEVDMCLKRMKFIQKQNKQTLKLQASFEQRVKNLDTYDEYLKYSFITHKNTLLEITNVLIQALFNRIIKLNEMIWGWYNYINKIPNKDPDKVCIKLYKNIRKEIIDFIDSRQNPAFKPQPVTINTQLKFIRDYFLIEKITDQQNFTSQNFSHLDYLLLMVDDDPSNNMIDFVVTIPSLFIQFQSIYQQTIKNEEIKLFRIHRQISIPSNILTFVIFVQNKQWKQFSYSNFSYLFVPKRAATIDSNKDQKQLNYQLLSLPQYFSIIEFFFSYEKEGLYQVKIETSNPRCQAKKFSNKFQSLLTCYTDKLRNSLMYFCVFNKLISPLMVFNSKVILYDLWDDLSSYQASYSYPFLEETFPTFEKQSYFCQIAKQTLKEEVKEYHQQSDFIYD